MIQSLRPNLEQVFGSSEQASCLLKNISCEFSGPQIICLLGNNGSGKSTLLKICAGILEPSQGTVFLNDQNIFQLDRKQRARDIVWQPQNLRRPYQMTVSEFMELTSPTQNGYLVSSSYFSFQEALQAFEIEEFKNQNVENISGGEWKRVQLARIWQSNYKLVLLDEPDSDLDLRHKKKLVHFCQQYVLKNNAVLIIATHDIIFANELADTVCALANGYLVWNSKSDDFWKTKVVNKVFSTKVF